MVEFGAGRRWWKRYTPDWGRTGERAWTWPRHALARGAGLAGGDRGLAGARSSTTRTGPTGTRRRCSTSSTSSSTAARSGRPARSAGRSPTADDPGRFALLECLDYPFYDTRRRRLLRLVRAARSSSRSSSARDPRPARGDPRRRPGDRRRSRRPGCRPRARSAAPSRTTSAGPDDDPFLRPNWYRFQDVNVWKDLGPKFVLQVVARRGGRRRRPATR